MAASGPCCVLWDLSLRLMDSVVATQAPEHTGSAAAAHGLWSVGSVVVLKGLVAPLHMGSEFPDQESNLSPLHCRVDSLPLNHQGSPDFFFKGNLFYLVDA